MAKSAIQEEKSPVKELRQKWFELTLPFCDDENLVEKRWKEIQKAYTGEKRHYHNLDHLAYMFDLRDEISDKLEDKEMFDFAIFYHDYIFRVQRKDNEERSALEAYEKLSEFGVPGDRAKYCKELIASTETNKPLNIPDSDYLNDIDLAILGEPPEKYDEYLKKIRKEFSIYPDFLFNPGRKNVLNHFLEKDSIYQTDYFKKRYEKQARKNIEHELESL